MKRSGSPCQGEEIEIVKAKKPATNGLVLDLEQETISDDSDEASASSSSAALLAKRLGKCEVCAARDAIYTCPKCEVKTCCLDCVKIHKKELQCDGIRDRTKFIPLKQMSKMDFMSDYYFLEECTRYVADRKSDKIKRYTRFNCELPVHLYRLQRAAGERKCKLKFLLQNFQRHKENTTYYDWKARKLWWRIKWIFVNASNRCYVDEKCYEGEYLRDLLDKYVNEKSEERVPEKKALEYYQSKGINQVKVFLKAEGIKRCKDRFYLLDVNKSLKDNLSGKTVVEYPLLYISYEQDPCGFDIIDSDEDLEAETKSHQAHFEQLRKDSLERRRREQCQSPEEEDLTFGLTLKKLQQEKRHEERQRKREEYEKQQALNYLFTDEQLMDILSSSSEEEQAHNDK